MDEFGRKLWTIRKQRKLSLRQVERLTTAIAERYGDKARRVSASWLGRIERESHSIAHKRLESLEEAYSVSHEELIGEPIPADEETRSLHFQFPAVPVTALKALTGHGGPPLPPERWLSYFPETILLPPLLQIGANGKASDRQCSRNGEPLLGVLGAKDNTLVPIARPGAVVEIDPTIRFIHQKKAFRSVFERPIYFLHSHNGYHCGWVELDHDEEVLMLVPSTMTTGPHLRWRYRRDVEVIGLVIRILTRTGYVDHQESFREATFKPPTAGRCSSLPPS
jgi:transcriptional regulator with XRE-family HTH domain